MTHRNNTRLSRRAFIATSAVAGLAATQATARASASIRTGLIGCGEGGRELLAAMRDSGGRFVPAVIADCDKNKLHAAAPGTTTNVETDWQRLVRCDDIDAVFIATPDHLHGAMAAAALQAGKHVYILPPFARTAEEARALEAHALENGRVLHVAADPAEYARWTQAKIAIGQTGAPLWIQAEAPCEPPCDGAHWQRRRECSHGPAARQLFNMLYPMQHQLNLGAPERATALGGVFDGEPGGTPDALLMTLRYDSGVTVVLGSRGNPARGQQTPLMRGLLDSVELPITPTASRAVHDLAQFENSVSGDHHGAAERLRAARIAQAAVCNALDMCSHFQPTER